MVWFKATITVFFFIFLSLWTGFETEFNSMCTVNKTSVFPQRVTNKFKGLRGGFLIQHLKDSEACTMIYTLNEGYSRALFLFEEVNRHFLSFEVITVWACLVCMASDSKQWDLLRSKTLCSLSIKPCKPGNGVKNHYSICESKPFVCSGRPRQLGYQSTCLRFCLPVLFSTNYLLRIQIQKGVASLDQIDCLDFIPHAFKVFPCTLCSIVMLHTYTMSRLRLPNVLLQFV